MFVRRGTGDLKTIWLYGVNPSNVIEPRTNHNAHGCKMHPFKAGLIVNELAAAIHM